MASALAAGPALPVTPLLRHMELSVRSVCQRAHWVSEGTACEAGHG